MKTSGLLPASFPHVPSWLRIPCKVHFPLLPLHISEDPISNLKKKIFNWKEIDGWTWQFVEKQTLSDDDEFDCKAPGQLLELMLISWDCREKLIPSNFQIMMLKYFSRFTIIRGLPPAHHWALIKVFWAKTNWFNTVSEGERFIETDQGEVVGGEMLVMSEVRM